MKGLSSTFIQFLVIAFIISVIAINSCSVNETLSAPPLSKDFPEYKIDYTGDIENIQSQFDEEMWKTFVALCWPADGLNPVSNGSITAQKDARPLFENYSYNYDLFLLNVNDTTKHEPIAWGDSEALNQQRQQRWKRWSKHSDLCPDLVDKAGKKGITNMASIVPLDEFIQASNGEKPHVPLVDLNQTFVYSSVLYNETTFDYVKKNKLYSLEGIKRAKQNVTEEKVHHVVKHGDVYKDTTLVQKVNQLEEDFGSMHLKTSWKILGAGDDTTKFHKAWGAVVFNNLNSAVKDYWEPQCSLVRIGLVGMHITVKTEDQPNAIWTTFEHVDNCPEKGGIQDKKYNFYNVASTAPVNEAPKNNEIDTSSHLRHHKWFNPSGSKVKAGQIVREVPIPQNTKTLNATYQNLLKGTVWANYQLVGTQWMNPSDDKVYPRLLSNTTLETFEQTGASCFGCHRQVTANTFKDGIKSDQFLMGPNHEANYLNVRVNFMDHSFKPDTLNTSVYSDYMWSLLKWNEHGHLTWKQI